MRVLGQDDGQDVLDEQRDAAERAGAHRRGVDDLVDELGEVAALERRAAGEAAVGDRAERVDVGEVGDLAAGGLLGGHVLRRADDALAGQGALAAQELGHAEVEDLPGRAGVEEQVVGLEVAVDDAGEAGDLEAAGDLVEQGDDLVGRQPVLGAQPGGEVGAVQALHGEVGHGGVGARQLVDADDVRRLEARGDGHLAVEALDEGGAGGGARVEQLDGGGSAVAARGLVDLAHGAAAQDEAELEAAHGLVGPAALVGAVGALRLVDDLGEGLLLVAQDAHRLLQLGERPGVQAARPAAEAVAGAEEADHEDLGDPELARLGIEAGEDAAIGGPAEDDRDGDGEVAADADHQGPDRRPLQAAERDEHQGEHVDHDHGRERAEVDERRQEAEVREEPQDADRERAVELGAGAEVEQHDVAAAEQARADPEHGARGGIAAEERRQEDRADRRDDAEGVEGAHPRQVGAVERLGRGGDRARRLAPRRPGAEVAARPVDRDQRVRRVGLRGEGVARRLGLCSVGLHARILARLAAPAGSE